MIVKIKNSNECYSFYDADSIVQSRVKIPAKELFPICNNETLFILNSDVLPEKGYLKLNLYKNQRVVQWIITDKRCYIMNSEGRTIEKIN